MFGRLLAFGLSLLVTFPFLSASCAIPCFKSEYGVYTLFAVGYFEQISLELGKRSVLLVPLSRAAICWSRKSLICSLITSVKLRSVEQTCSINLVKFSG